MRSTRHVPVRLPFLKIIGVTDSPSSRISRCAIAGSLNMSNATHSKDCARVNSSSRE
nr:MAG TPA: hypothetical protein [Caudoviricetes sp.]DAP53391.1 MAG TPA: hypothetical protein [Caudoviricetes sp.]